MIITKGCNTRLPILKNLCIKIIFGLLKFVVLISKDTKHIFIHLAARGQSQNQLRMISIYGEQTTYLCA